MITNARQRTGTTPLLSASEFEAHITPTLDHPHPPARLILMGFGGLDLLVGDLGTEATHAVLREVGDRLCRALPRHLHKAHLFGDRFAILVLDDHPSQAITECLLAAFRAPLHCHGEPVSLHPRFGVAHTINANTSRDLLRRATAALQRAEASGGTTPALYQTNQMPLPAADPALQRQLQSALEQGQIQPWFQPIWRISDGSLIAVEALARWHHPERGVLLPGSFLPIASRAGLIAQLDTSIRCQALSWLARMRDRHAAARDLSVAVNVADADLAELDLPQTIDSELSQRGLGVEHLRLELSERSQTAQSPEVQGRIRLMASTGLRWHLDDFGAGNSNIQRLCQLPFSAVKLDISLIRGLGRDPHAERLLAPMIALARVLNLEVIAEGVERNEQLQTLRRLGCDKVQGYLLSPPRPAAAIEKLLSETAPTPPAVRAAAPAGAQHAQTHL